MYHVTALLSIACAFGAGAAIEHRVWWAVPFATLGAIVFFFVFPEDD